MPYSSRVPHGRPSLTFKSFYLRGRKRKRETSGISSVIHPDDYNPWNWDRLKLRARNSTQVNHMGDRWVLKYLNCYLLFSGELKLVWELSPDTLICNAGIPTSVLTAVPKRTPVLAI